MATARAKVLEFGVELDEVLDARNDRGGGVLRREAEWWPEHLLLVALARCSLKSLDYHAKRAGVEVAATATANGAVTKRDEDGRYAFVSLEVRADVELDPLPDADDVRALLTKAERDCFVGASLTVAPRYRWSVNGEELP